MDKSAEWIWLNKALYPLYQQSERTYFDPEREKNKFVAAEFKIEKNYSKKIKTANIDISADVKFILYINGEFIGTGPVCAGGDFANVRSMPIHYCNTYKHEVNDNSFRVYVIVQKNTVVQCDMSQGRPGVIFSAELLFEDGSREFVVSDEQWLARADNKRYAHNKTDYTLTEDIWRNASAVESVWKLEKAPLKMLCEEEIKPINFKEITVEPKQFKSVVLEFDKIYSCCYKLRISSGNGCFIVIEDFEKDMEKAAVSEVITADKPIEFRSLTLTSAGSVKLNIFNTGDVPLTVSDFSACFSHYPSEGEGSFISSDESLNKIYEMGKWALKICKQTIELDSPKHQENLGCTGDYFIASLMNYFTHSDTELTRLDIIRTANYLEMTGGFMFHTIYSLIWVLMLYDYYMFTDDKKIFDETKNALTALLERFNGYTDNRGIVSSPPNYMFVDWLIVDGISLHHPPAALGQAAMNAFYYGALTTAARILKINGNEVYADKYKRRAEKLKSAFNTYFYDNEKQLYFDGLNEDYKPDKWLPPNTDKRYYSWHTNSLAVLFDIAPVEKQSELMKRILNDKTLIMPQPYFMHFVLEAIYKTGLFEEYGMEQLRRWNGMIKFEKGLQEGWYDMSGYGFDYSHVWGGTPTYQLPSKILGFKMEEPGFKRISLKPNLFDLSYANIKIPTPFGDITAELKKGRNPVINVPKEIECDIIF